MKKLCCYGLGLLLAVSFFVPRLAPAQDLVERRGGQNMLFNFNPISLFFLLPALVGNPVDGSRIQGQTAMRSQKSGFRNPFGGDGDTAGGDQQYLMSNGGANSQVANLTPQDFAKNFATNLLAQTSQVPAQRVEGGTAPFFFTAFFQTLGIDTKQLPFFRLFQLQSQFPTIDRNTNTFELTKGIIQFISGGSSRELRSSNADTYRPNTDTNTNTNTNSNNDSAQEVFGVPALMHTNGNGQNDLEQ